MGWDARVSCAVLGEVCGRESRLDGYSFSLSFGVRPSHLRSGCDGRLEGGGYARQWRGSGTLRCLAWMIGESLAEDV